MPANPPTGYSLATLTAPNGTTVQVVKDYPSGAQVPSGSTLYRTNGSTARVWKTSRDAPIASRPATTYVVSFPPGFTPPAPAPVPTAPTACCQQGSARDAAIAAANALIEAHDLESYELNL